MAKKLLSRPRPSRPSIKVEGDDRPPRSIPGVSWKAEAAERQVLRRTAPRSRQCEIRPRRCHRRRHQDLHRMNFRRASGAAHVVIEAEREDDQSPGRGGPRSCVGPRKPAGPPCCCETAGRSAGRRSRARSRFRPAAGSPAPGSSARTGCDQRGGTCPREALDRGDRRNRQSESDQNAMRYVSTMTEEAKPPIAPRYDRPPNVARRKAYLAYRA